MLSAKRTKTILWISWNKISWLGTRMSSIILFLLIRERLQMMSKNEFESADRCIEIRWEYAWINCLRSAKSSYYSYANAIVSADITERITYFESCTCSIFDKYKYFRPRKKHLDSLGFKGFDTRASESLDMHFLKAYLMDFSNFWSTLLRRSRTSTRWLLLISTFQIKARAMCLLPRRVLSSSNENRGRKKL